MSYQNPNTKSYTVRLPENLRDRFLEVTREHDENGAKLIRDFMRDYLKRKGQGSLSL